MTHRWRLRTLGGLSLLRDGVAVEGASAQRRRLGLLAVIAAAGDAGVSRDRLQAMLWPENDSASARHALNQLLSLVRRDLGSGIFSGTAELRMGTDDFSTDVLELERAAAAGDDEQVVALYGGPFLDGFHLSAVPEFEQWHEAKRIQLSTIYAVSLERLAAAAGSRGDHASAAGLWRRLTVIDPLNSRLAMELMRTLAASGDVAGALQHARIHAAFLRTETGLDPDVAVSALVTELRARPADSSVAAGASTDDTTLRVRSNQASTDLPVPALTHPALIGRSRRRRIYSLLAASAALVGGVLFVAVSRGRGPDEGLIAVAPFEVLDSDLALWREGMMDVLARALDGAGPLRSVSPTSVMKLWLGRSDVPSGQALGRRTGARLVVLGTLLRSGRDSVRGTTTLIDAQTGDVIAERESRDDILHIDRVADSLAVALLRDIGVRRPLQAVRTASLGSASLPALKAFLRGEQLLREGQMDSARVFYARAAELDHHFALALHRLSWTTLTNTALVIDSSYRSIAFQAQRFNHGLPRRDSLLVLLDSLRVAGTFNPFFDVSPISVESGRRILAIALLLAHDYPTDPEAQYQLGDLRLHFAPVLGTETSVMRADFDRAIALDSSFGPAYEHMVALALDDQDVIGARQYNAAIERYAPLTDAGHAAPLFDAILGQQPAPMERLTTLVDSVPLYTVTAALSSTLLWMDSAETAVRMAAQTVQRTRRELPVFTAATLDIQSLVLAERGHLREAHQAYARGATEDPRLYVELALLGAVPDNEAEKTFDRWRHRDELLTTSRALPWWAAHRDSQAVKDLQLRARRANPSDSIGIGRYSDWSSTLYLALARSDTSKAIATCREMKPESLPFRFVEEVDCGRMLIARGRYREAEQLLEPRHALHGPIGRVMRNLEWARAAERAGNRGEAAKRYAFVESAWRNADPSLRAQLTR